MPCTVTPRQSTSVPFTVTPCHFTKISCTITPLRSMNVAGGQLKIFFFISVFSQNLIFSLVKTWETEASIKAGNYPFEINFTSISEKIFLDQLKHSKFSIFYRNEFSWLKFTNQRKSIYWNQQSSFMSGIFWLQIFFETNSFTLDFLGSLFGTSLANYLKLWYNHFILRRFPLLVPTLDVTTYKLPTLFFKSTTNK